MTRQYKFQKRKTVEGIELFTCNTCDEFKTRNNFVKTNKGFGITSECYACKYQKKMIAGKDKYLAERRIGNKKKQNIMVQAQKDFDKFASIKKRSITISKNVVDLIILDVRKFDATKIGNKIGVHSNIVSKICTGQKKTVSIKTADMILDEYPDIEIRKELYPHVSDFIPEGHSWSLKHKCCESCGRIDSAHASKGKCVSCYTRTKRGLKARVEKNQWSLYWTCCHVCGSKERDHKSRGLCTMCFYRKKRSGNIDKFPVQVPSKVYYRNQRV